MKKILALSFVLILTLSLMAVTFADNPSDLNTWKNGANSGLLNEASSSTRDLGASVDALIKTIGKIMISVVVSFIGMKTIWGKDAQAKKDIKERAILLLGGAIVIYFGIDIVIKLLEFFKNAFM